MPETVKHGAQKVVRWAFADGEDPLGDKRRLEAELEQLRRMHAHQLAGQQDEYQRQLDAQRAAYERELASLREQFQLNFDRQQERSRQVEAQLQQAQLATFSGPARAGYPPDEDRVIMQDVDLLHMNVWAWAKRHCLAVADHLPAILGDGKNGALMACLNEAGISPKLFNKKYSLRIKPLPALVLGAIVIRDIYTKMFDNPFFFYDSEVFTTNGEKGAALSHTLAMLDKRKSSTFPKQVR